MMRNIYFGCVAFLVVFYAFLTIGFLGVEKKYPAIKLPDNFPVIAKISDGELHCWPMNVDHRDLYFIGWSGESKGRWSERSQASISFKLDRANFPSQLVVDGYFFLHEKVPEQRIKVLLNGKAIGEWQATHGKQGPLDWRAFMPDSISEDELTLTFDIKNPTSPRSVGMGNDNRKLGIFIKQFCLAGKVGNKP